MKTNELILKNKKVEEEKEEVKADNKNLLSCIEQLREALIWCSASNDFQDGGQARAGWLNGVEPLLESSEALLEGTKNKKYWHIP